MQGCASSTLPRTQAEAKYLRSEKWCVSCAGHEVIAPETRGWQPFSKQPRRLFVLAGTTQRPQLQRFGLLLWYSKICCWTRERFIVVQKEPLRAGFSPEPSPFGLTLQFPRLQLAIVVFVFTKLLLARLIIIGTQLCRFLQLEDPKTPSLVKT